MGQEEELDWKAEELRLEKHGFFPALRWKLRHPAAAPRRAVRQVRFPAAALRTHCRGWKPRSFSLTWTRRRNACSGILRRKSLTNTARRSAGSLRRPRNESSFEWIFPFRRLRPGFFSSNGPMRAFGSWSGFSGERPGGRASWGSRKKSAAVFSAFPSRREIRTVKE